MLFFDMDKFPPLKDFCHNDRIYFRIKNALWKANGYGYWPPSDWEPEIDDFRSLDAKMISGMGSVSLKILRAWVAEND
ncbi:hypothetical protein [Pseudochrobactrum sp. MP213Fo]|uniref:hypothetical protein n=1 Tax=Pseudochrobactrum sp. MP213Fo TaxID=3022250 RepID=UPI003B9E79EC